MATDDLPSTDALTDHDYDGIQEYDNPLPGWWVWLFNLTIIFCAPYVMWYHLGDGPSLDDKYEAEVAAFAEQLMATYGELEPDEATIHRFMDDTVAMSGMASLFRSRCAQCHLPDGSGSVGPNLTDTSWIHVKTLPDIATVLTNGVLDRGMPAWGGTLSKTQIVLLSAYVAQMQRKTLPGRPVDPRAKDIGPWPAAPADGSASVGDAPGA